MQCYTTNIDNSINDSGNTDIDAEFQEQNCSVVVDQYNNAVAGDAISADEAIAETAAAVNAPVNVIQVCLQAGGDIILDSGDDDGNDDGNRTTVETTTRQTDVLTETIPDKVLANTGGASALLPASVALVGAGLLGFGMLRRR